MKTLACLVSVSCLCAADITIDTGKSHQLIDGIGTCTMHWTMQKTGLTNPKLQEALGPNGLDCSIARFAVPTDLLPETADANAITVDALAAKAAENNTFKWLKAVAARPGVTVLATAWSPPGWMKTTGKTIKGGALRPDRVAHLARYDAAVVEVLKRDFGVTVDCFSPQNELSFVEDYDSCVYKPEEYANLVAEMGRVFAAAKLKTRIIGPEDMTKFPDRLMKFVHAIGQQPDAKKAFAIVASHGYSDGVIDANNKDDYEGLLKAVKPLGLPVWMTETSTAGQGWADEQFTAKRGKNAGKKQTRHGALGLGACMHNAFVHGGNSAFIFWCLSGDVGKSAAAEPESLMNGEQMTKKAYVFSHFSRYVRPGMHRIDAEPSTSGELLTSAYRAEDGTTVVELVNDDDAEAAVNLSFAGKVPAGPLSAFRTSASDDRAKQPDVAVQGGKAHLILPASCIVTLVGR